MSAVRVAVVEQRRLVRDVVAGLLAGQPDIELVGAVADERQLADLVPGDVLVVGPTAEPTRPTAEHTRLIRYRDDGHLIDVLDAVRGRSATGAPAVASASGSPTPPLTPRQRHVLGGIAAGLSSREIAATMGITGKSVDNHKQRIFHKLGAQSQAHAVAIALEAGRLPLVTGARPPDADA